MKHALALAAILGGCAAPAATHDADAVTLFAGRTAGHPVGCVEQSRLGDAQAVDSRTLLYRESTRRWWRNDLPDACPGLDDNSILVVEVQGSRLCRNDRFRPIERGSSIPGPFCRLGNFTPYDRPKN